MNDFIKRKNDDRLARLFSLGTTDLTALPKSMQVTSISLASLLILAGSFDKGTLTPQELLNPKSNVVDAITRLRINRLIIAMLKGGQFRVPSNMKIPNSQDREKFLLEYGVKIFSEELIQVGALGFVSISKDSYPPMVNVSYSGIKAQKYTLTNPKTILELTLCGLLYAVSGDDKGFTTRSTWFESLPVLKFTDFTFNYAGPQTSIPVAGSMIEQFATQSGMTLSQWHGAMTLHRTGIYAPTDASPFSFIGISVNVGSTTSAMIPIPLSRFSKLIYPIAKHLRDAKCYKAIEEGKEAILTPKQSTPNLILSAPANLLKELTNEDLSLAETSFMLMMLCNTSVYIVKAFTQAALAEQSISRKSATRFIPVVVYPNGRVFITGSQGRDYADKLHAHLMEAGVEADVIYSSTDKMPLTYITDLFDSILSISQSTEEAEQVEPSDQHDGESI